MEANKDRVERIDALLHEYLSEIDDFQNAKRQFIKEVNLVLRTRGAKSGIMCRELFKETFSEFAENLASDEILENLGAD